MPQTKTSWEDLANLGWPINDVFKKANAKRDGTMKDKNDIHLNKSIAKDYHWWSYNTMIDRPYVISSIPTSVSREEVAWTYDNTESSKPFSDSWSESWTNTRTVTVSVKESVSINLWANITLFNVASSGFDVSVDLAQSSAQTKEMSYALSHSLTMEVGPREKLSIMRVITTTGETTEYGQKFGLTKDSMLGTEGKKYNGHYYWGYNINSLLGTPTGRMKLVGISRNVTYAYKIIRESADGVRTASPLDVDIDGVVSVGGEALPDSVGEEWVRDITSKTGSSEAPVRDVAFAD
ncbi:cytolysin-like protein [Phanerochaete sordida]|uniref:Cytolysin-like protein n=1 Tax=Phanerochaete sordida TaxID=48140 RepID=A0A9P3GCV9_9APHY|nr:cytolysin-like protein [Phanerochaete sordida]